MKKTQLRSLVLAAALPWMANPADAHHGWGAFVSGAQVTLNGTVTEFHFVNPHCVVEFQVKDDQGQFQTWEGELSSPANLAPRGWTATSLEDGEKITISGYPAKNGMHALRVTRIVLASGRELKLSGGS
jgi:hypothetical protein